jgi:isoquinoline 1-oxidoreductase beta subunit
MEGGIGFGLGAALHSAITLMDGKVEQNNFDGYQVLRIAEMPKVDVHIVQSGEAPTGVGEPGVAPVGPAVANAIFAATGKRLGCGANSEGGREIAHVSETSTS